jgi:hypothetical protein
LASAALAAVIFRFEGTPESVELRSAMGEVAIKDEAVARGGVLGIDDVEWVSLGFVAPNVFRRHDPSPERLCEISGGEGYPIPIAGLNEAEGMIVRGWAFEASIVGGELVFGERGMGFTQASCESLELGGIGCSVFEFNHYAKTVGDVTRLSLNYEYGVLCGDEFGGDWDCHATGRFLREPEGVPVPEPGTLALLCAGVAASRRRGWSAGAPAPWPLEGRGPPARGKGPGAGGTLSSARAPAPGGNASRRANRISSSKASPLRVRPIRGGQT